MSISACSLPAIFSTDCSRLDKSAWGNRLISLQACVEPMLRITVEEARVPIWHVRVCEKSQILRQRQPSVSSLLPRLLALMELKAEIKLTKAALTCNTRPGVFQVCEDWHQWNGVSCGSVRFVYLVYWRKSRVVWEAGLGAIQYQPYKIFHSGVQWCGRLLCESLLRLPRTDNYLMFLILPRCADGAK